MIQNNKFTADIQLKTLIENSATFGHRSLLVVYNDPNSEESCSGEQVMIVHHLISKFSSERPNILWCHKKHSKTPKVSQSVLKKLEKNLKSGNCDISRENAFHIFLLSTQVTFCAFNETQNVLGTTFGLCVIQDFDGLTPNTLCRMIETVKGGGAIVFLMPPEVSCLKDLFRYRMDVHSKLKTVSHPDIQYRFNERFVISLGWCKTCLVLDKQLKVVRELTSQRTFKGLVAKETRIELEDEKLTQLVESLADAEKPLPQLAKLCRTMDQAKTVLKMIDVITDKNGRSTVSISAARGRGKSAAMGLATAAAIFFGVNNIYVTSPSPQNLNTFFEFLFQGFDSLDYREAEHYDIIQSTNAEFNGAVIRVNVFARHRQVVQYVYPGDSSKVTQAELVIIDEAAAIPLSQVTTMLGFHNVFMASTINGYEGTGRSLSLKLLKRLRQQTVPVGATATSSNQEDTALSNCRPLHECTLETSIRYQPNDPVERWLTRLLCLDATCQVPPVTTCPHADTCHLYYVNRDVLLSCHPATETFLCQSLSLLVSSHYRNSPDDLQVLFESDTHHLFVLLPSVHKQKKDQGDIPTPFAVVQVCEEGSIPSSVSGPILERGESPEGDLIPWNLASHFLNPKLTKLAAVRVVRVATHPDYQSMGYGTKAIQLLKEYYKGRFISMDSEEEMEQTSELEKNEVGGQEEELIGPKKVDQPLLMKLSERSPEKVDYIGVSYGVTEQLFRFWKKLDFVPVHISQKKNRITGEHNCIMVHPLTENGDFSLSSSTTQRDSSTTQRDHLPKWLKSLVDDFLSRFLTLLGSSFTHFSPQLSLNVISSLNVLIRHEEIEWYELEHLISGHDLQRIESYTKNLSDRHLITDLLPSVATLFFLNRLADVHLSPTQSELLIGCGLGYSPIESVCLKMDLPIESALGQFNRAMKRLFKALSQVQERSVARHLPREVRQGEIFTPVTISLDQDLEESAQDYENRERMKELGLNALREFSVKGDEKEWQQVAMQGRKPSGLVTIKSAIRPPRMTEQQFEKELEGPLQKKGKRDTSQKRGTGRGRGHSNNKRRK